MNSKLGKAISFTIYFFFVRKLWYKQIELMYLLSKCKTSGMSGKTEGKSQTEDNTFLSA